MIPNLNFPQSCPHHSSSLPELLLESVTSLMSDHPSDNPSRTVSASTSAMFTVFPILVMTCAYHVICSCKSICEVHLHEFTACCTFTVDLCMMWHTDWQGRWKRGGRGGPGHPTFEGKGGVARYIMQMYTDPKYWPEYFRASCRNTFDRCT